MEAGAAGGGLDAAQTADRGDTMIVRLGPVTIMSTKTRDAYAVLANAAYASASA